MSVSLLGGTIESIGGKTAGRVTIAVTPPTVRVAQTLAEWGLHAESVDGQVSRQAEAAA